MRGKRLRARVRSLQMGRQEALVRARGRGWRMMRKLHYLKVQIESS